MEFSKPALLLSFGNTIACHLPLPATSETGHLIGPQSAVFGAPALHPGPPFLPVAQGHFLFHQLNDFGFGQAKLGSDGLERRPVLPGHFDDAVYRSIRKLIFQVQLFQNK